MQKLLDRLDLEQSSLVANSAMNRERGIEGGNSYEKELAFNPIFFLQKRLQGEKIATWLDICCGSGKALIEAAQIFHSQRIDAKIQITGIDLVSFFAPIPSDLRCLRLIESSIFDWQPDYAFDLITCVHGLHYLGDKLGAIQKAASWLKSDGVFLAHLDVNNLKLLDANSTGRDVIKVLRQSGLQYQPRKHLLVCQGHKSINSDFQYLGADDKAGANYTGQPVVNSYYRRA